MWTPDGRYYVFVSALGGAQNIWVTAEARDWFHKVGREPVQLTVGAVGTSDPLPGAPGRVITFVSWAPFRAQTCSTGSGSPTAKWKPWRGLQGFHQPAGLLGDWMGLTPQDTPLFVRDSGTMDIYRLEWLLP